MIKRWYNVAFDSLFDRRVKKTILSIRKLTTGIFLSSKIRVILAQLLPSSAALGTQFVLMLWGRGSLTLFMSLHWPQGRQGGTKQLCSVSTTQDCSGLQTSNDSVMFWCEMQFLGPHQIWNSRSNWFIKSILFFIWKSWNYFNHFHLNQFFLNQWNSHILHKILWITAKSNARLSFVSSKHQALTLLHLMAPFVQVQELHSCSQVVWSE